jgi:hypothetical protein
MSAEAERVQWIELPLRSAREGQPVLVAVQEPSIAEFSIGIPEVLPDPQTQCFQALGIPQQDENRAAWQQFVHAMLARAIVEPEWLHGDPVAVRQLGEDADRLGTRMLQQWGVSASGPGHGKSLLRLVRRMARTLHVPPTEILEWPASKFWRNQYILFSPDLADED